MKLEAPKPLTQCNNNDYSLWFAYTISSICTGPVLPKTALDGRSLQGAANFVAETSSLNRSLHAEKFIIIFLVHFAPMAEFLVY